MPFLLRSLDAGAEEYWDFVANASEGESGFSQSTSKKSFPEVASPPPEDVASSPTHHSGLGGFFVVALPHGGINV